MKASATPIWVRLPNIPLHFWMLHFLSTIGNSLGHFIRIDGDSISRGLVTFSHIFLEMDISVGLLKKILIDWTDDELYIQLLNYQNTTFRGRSCQELGHLWESYHFF